MAWHRGSHTARIGCWTLLSLVLGFAPSIVQAGDAGYEAHVTQCLEDQIDATVQLDHCEQAIRSGRAAGQELGHLLVKRGFILLGEGKPGPALESFTQAIPVVATPAMAWWGSGVAHARLQQLDEALADLDKAIALEPYTRALTILLYIARSQVHAGLAGLGPLAKPGAGPAPGSAEAEHAAAALVDAGKAVALGPDTGRNSDTPAERLLAVGKVREALATLDAELGGDPRSGEAYYLRGVVHDLLGQGDAALGDFDKAIALAPSLADAYAKRGRLYLERQRSDEALADLDVAVVLKPEDAAPYYLRAAAYARLGQQAEAARDVAKVCTLEPRLLSALADPRRLADPAGSVTTAGASSACSP